VRWLSLVAGIAMIAVAVAAVTRVSDTREGLIAEVVTLLGALAGISLLIYGLAARPRPRVAQPSGSGPAGPVHRPRSSSDLKLGGGGIGLALVLLVGLAISGGLLWAALGLALLLPMIAGCVYLFVRYLRASP
jgi:hypothetical protein